MLLILENMTSVNILAQKLYKNVKNMVTFNIYKNQSLQN